MGIQEQMNTDNLWSRNYMNEPSGSKNFGHLWIDPNAANYRERVEMSYRTMGQRYNWELEKFRLDLKSIDKSNKKRFFKNTARFIKNPFGYFFWKFLVYSNAPRLIGFGIGGILLGGIFLGIKEGKNLNRKMKWYLASGENIKGNGTQNLGYYNTSLPMPYTIFFNALYNAPDPTYFVTNPADVQNYRLHFEMLKKNDKL